MAENDYGNLKNTDDTYFFVGTYLKPYIKGSEISRENTKYGKNVTVLRLKDKSSAYFIYDYCLLIYYDINGELQPNAEGSDQFNFILCMAKNNCKIEKGKISSLKCNSNSKAENRSTLYNICKYYRSRCTQLIEYDNWQIKNDYPIKL